MTATASVSSPPPLSVAQEALWYLSILAPHQVSYNETISIRKHGPFDVSAFRRAFNEILRRHEAWHTVFDTVDGEPAQILQPVQRFDMPVIDFSHRTRDQAERQAVRLAAEVSKVPYDLRHGPLVRPRLIRFPGEEHRLYLGLHHLIFDGVSVYRVLLPELVALYDAFCAGRPSPLPEPPTQYADYARWEQQWITEPKFARRLGHWRSHLSDIPEHSLPLDHPRPPTPRLGGGVLPMSVPGETVDRLREVGASVGATLFQVLATTWSLLLGRYSGADDVVIATAADLRQRPELESVVGYCLTPLVLRIDLSGDPRFTELVIRVRNELLDGLDHLVPFERLVRELQPNRVPNANPIYQTMLVMEPPTATRDPGWSVHQMESEIGDAVGSAKLDLELELDERPEGHIAGRLIYDRDLLERSTVERMAGHWGRLLAGVAATPAAPVSSLAILTATEQDRQLVEWNATATVSDHPARGLDELIHERAAHQPQAVAVADGSEAIDYAELERRAASPAGRRSNAGELSTASEPSVEQVIESLAALKEAGRDPTLEPGGEDTWNDYRQAAAVNLATALVTELGIGSADTVLVLPSMLTRDPVVSLWMPLIAGARIVLAPVQAAGDGRLVSRLIAAEGVSFLHAAPRDWSALIETGLRSARGLRALSGGEPLSRELADAVLKRCGVLWNAYGGPDTSGYCTLACVARTGPVAIGRPLANVRVYVLDDHGLPVPVGVTGELVLAGIGVWSGHMSPPDQSAHVPDPVGDGVAYRTGEQVRWLPDGQLELAPRARAASKATTGIEPV
ncbi:MAG: condensation domain-containing protein [Solirubrobacteraceae bacterium]